MSAAGNHLIETVDKITSQIIGYRELPQEVQNTIWDTINERLIQNEPVTITAGSSVTHTEQTFKLDN